MMVGRIWPRFVGAHARPLNFRLVQPAPPFEHEEPGRILQMQRASTFAGTVTATVHSTVVLKLLPANHRMPAAFARVRAQWPVANGLQCGHRCARNLARRELPRHLAQWSDAFWTHGPKNDTLYTWPRSCWRSAPGSHVACPAQRHRQ